MHGHEPQGGQAARHGGDGEGAHDAAGDVDHVVAWLLEVAAGEDERVHGDDGKARKGVKGDERVVAEVGAAGLSGVFSDGGEEGVEEEKEAEAEEEE